MRNRYYGIFKDIFDLYEDEIKELSIYEGCFADYYDMFDADSKELEFYLSQARLCGRDVLELCCGNGRITIPLAMSGFHVYGYDLSGDMLRKLEIRKNRLPKSLQKNIHTFREDIFLINSSRQYDFICLPATTICILAEDENLLVDLFRKVYALLKNDGSFVFDIREGYQDGQRCCSKISSLKQCTSHSTSLTLIQEFNHYVVGRSIANFYTQIEYIDGHKEKYIAYADKKIIPRVWLEKIIANARFFILNENTVKHDGFTETYFVLKKNSF